MIASFIHRGLDQLWATTQTKKIDPRMHGRILRRLNTLKRAESIADLNVPGYQFHALKGHNPTRYSIHVNGPWCVTFEFDAAAGEARRVNFEQYH